MFKEAFILTGNEFDKVKPDKSQAARDVVPEGRLLVNDDAVAPVTWNSLVFSHNLCVDCDTGEEIDCERDISEGGWLPGKTEEISDDVNSSRPDEPDPICFKPVYDTVENTGPGSVPLKGAKVRARRWFTIKTAITDEQGNFRVNHSFGGDVNYEIIWERAYWDIRDGNLTQAFLNGPKQSGAWNHTINAHKTLRFATIHRACYRYFYDNIDGLSRPAIGTKLKINYNDGAGTGINWGLEWQNYDFGLGLFPHIKIWRSSERTGRDWDTNEIFSVTIHELAHTTHIMEMNLGLVSFGQVSKIIRESWPEAVEWYLTRKEYVELGVTNYDDPDDFVLGDHKQWWRSDVDDHDYTPIFIDLVDDFNQFEERDSQFRPNENINGFQMQTIEDVILKDAYGLTSLRNELKRHKPSNVTDAQIDDYIDFYFNNL